MILYSSPGLCISYLDLVSKNNGHTIVFDNITLVVLRSGFPRPSHFVVEFVADMSCGGRLLKRVTISTVSIIFISASRSLLRKELIIDLTAVGRMSDSR